MFPPLCKSICLVLLGELGFLFPLGLLGLFRLSQANLRHVDMAEDPECWTGCSQLTC